MCISCGWSTNFYIPISKINKNFFVDTLSWREKYHTMKINKKNTAPITNLTTGREYNNLKRYTCPKPWLQSSYNLRWT